MWRKSRKWFISHRWVIIGCLWILAIVLGYTGFSDYFLAIGEAHSPGDIFYRTLQLFVFESGWVTGPISWNLQVARFLAPLMTVYTAVQTLAILLHRQFQLFSLRFLKNHVVICGLGRKGSLLSRRFHEIGERVVIIERDGNNESLERCLSIHYCYHILLVSQLGLC
jgi:hypothetical protein